MRKRAVHGPKEKRKYGPCGGTEDEGTRRRCFLRVRMSYARGVVRAGGGGGFRMDLLLFSLPLTWKSNRIGIRFSVRFSVDKRERRGRCTWRAFLPGLPVCRQHFAAYAVCRRAVLCQTQSIRSPQSGQQNQGGDQRLLPHGHSPVPPFYWMSSSFAMSFKLMVRILDTPFSCMVTPYSTSASSMVPRRWVMTIN